MARVGGNYFEGVAFPIVFGDRYMQISADELTGAPVVDLYRWDRDDNRLVAELLQGRPVAGASPITVDAQGGVGALRIAADKSSGQVVGYLSGGDDPRSVIVRPDRIEVREGDTMVMEMRSNSIQGFAVGIRLSDDGIAIAGGLPPDFPERRVIRGGTIVLSELVTGASPTLQRTDLEDCTLLGPAVLLPMDGVELRDSGFGPESRNLVIEIPELGDPIIGAIGLQHCRIQGCEFRGVALMVEPGARAGLLEQLAGDPTG